MRRAAALTLVAALGCGPDVASNDESDTDGTSTSTTWPGETDECVDGVCDPTCLDGVCTGTTTFETDTIDPCRYDEGGDSGCAETLEPDLCEWLNCLPGECVMGDDGPSCECPWGFASVGYACMECTAATSTWDVDVPMVELELAFTIAGAEPPRSALEGGRIVLRRLASNDVVVAGETWDSPLVVDVVPGLYEVDYEHLAGGDIAPINERVEIAKIDVNLGGLLAIDIPVVQLVGSFTVDGQAAPASQYENGELWLSTGADGSRARLGETADGEYSVRVVPGGYDIHYGLLAGGQVVPINADARIGAAQISGGAAEVVMDVDVGTAMAGGSITLAGLVPPSSDLENGRIVLVDDAIGASTEVGETRNGTWSARVAAGAYTLRYEWIAGGAVVPINENAHLGAVDLGADAQLDIDVPVISLSGNLTIAGAPVADVADAGELRLVDFAGGDAVELGPTSTTMYDVRVVPGMYDVVYSGTNPGTFAPTNTLAVVGQIAADSDPTVVDIDVPTVDIAGTITLDGAAPPGAPTFATIALREPTHLDSAVLGLTADGAFQATVIPGVYEVTYSLGDNDGTLPFNAAAAFAVIDVGASPLFDVDIPTADLAGAITVAGQTPPPGPVDVGDLLFRDLSGLDLAPLADTAAGAYAGVYVAGTYVLYYSVDSAAGGVPANSDAPLACLQLGQ